MHNLQIINALPTTTKYVDIKLKKSRTIFSQAQREQPLYGEFNPFSQSYVLLEDYMLNISPFTSLMGYKRVFGEKTKLGAIWRIPQSKFQQL